MNLKEAFRFQNKLQSMMDEAQSILGSTANITKVQNTYLRKKKAQREHHAKQRGSWYGISPVTRTVPNGKAYDRNRVKRTNRELAD